MSKSLLSIRPVCSILQLGCLSLVQFALLHYAMTVHAQPLAPAENVRPSDKSLKSSDDAEIEDLSDLMNDQDAALAAELAIQNVRERRIGQYEKQYPPQLETYRPLIKQARLSIVAIMIDGEQKCLGTVVDDQGGIVTKASELGDARHVDCIFSNDLSFPAELMKVNEQLDLALLQIDRVKTIPIQWAVEPAELGTMVITSSHQGDPLALGVVSVLPRSLVGSNLAFLGVGPGPGPREGGVQVLLVEEESAAAKAGLKEGDIILSLAGASIDSVTKLVNTIRAHKPGATVELKYRRGAEETTAEVILDSATLPGDREQRLQLMNRMGAIPSERNTEFPHVLQHDSPLFPEQCGGPLLNLDGQAIGLNIARAGRTDSFAVPARKLIEVLQQMKAESN
jgi:S1-C subfamily serine protease